MEKLTPFLAFPAPVSRRTTKSLVCPGLGGVFDEFLELVFRRGVLQAGQQRASSCSLTCHAVRSLLSRATATPASPLIERITAIRNSMNYSPRQVPSPRHPSRSLGAPAPVQTCSAEQRTSWRSRRSAARNELVTADVSSSDPSLAVCQSTKRSV